MQDVTRQDAALQNMGAGFAEAPVGRFPFLPPGTAPSANGCGADPLLLLTPCDHAIPDPEGFRAAVLRAVPAARAGRIVTFGIRPDGPETGYGWLDLGDPRGGTGLRDLRGFVEKPSAEHAARMLEAGNSLWNAGVFLARLSTLRAAFRTHAPRVAATVEAAMADARPDMAFLRPDAAAWDHVPDISIDHAVMEKAGNLSVAPYDDAWSDLGSWEAIWQEMPQDNAGNALQGAATAIDCSDTLLRSEAEGIRVVGIGLEDMIAVAMPDAVLVAPRARSQEVGRAVTALRAHGARQADAFPRDHRPWGWFETLALGDRFQVKRLHVAPGAALSLQSHVHRAEHWVVVQGTARVTLDDDIRLLGENQSIYIPLGARHRLENPGLIPMILIEVQTGSYLQEDDITRYEDIYARS
ncbi:mannose-1-phosphate guanylyltransferase/mannose-6-phosphate isomerase [Mesobaculum littorinae]|uniref:mannose-1-phosphate guanylyltransferase n=2 Tax=Mesobaculum littorinae TaxID=2486419 RepID=A0A438AHK4_9RHOB|nr:mannose-1-phosphate guanylyltransferase/mannose-6-phosphate isomerase [Mesobaculum littorinae]